MKPLPPPESADGDYPCVNRLDAFLTLPAKESDEQLSALVTNRLARK